MCGESVIGCPVWALYFGFPVRRAHASLIPFACVRLWQGVHHRQALHHGQAPHHGQATKSWVSTASWMTRAPAEDKGPLLRDGLDGGGRDEALRDAVQVVRVPLLLAAVVRGTHGHGARAERAEAVADRVRRPPVLAQRPAALACVA